MVTRRKSELAGTSTGRRPARWPYQLPAMVDEETDRRVRELSERNDEPLAVTLRTVLAEGLAVIEAREREERAAAVAARAAAKRPRKAAARVNESAA